MVLTRDLCYTESKVSSRRIVVQEHRRKVTHKMSARMLLYTKVAPPKVPKRRSRAGTSVQTFLLSCSKENTNFDLVQLLNTSFLQYSCFRTSYSEERDTIGLTSDRISCRLYFLVGDLHPIESFHDTLELP